MADLSGFSSEVFDPKAWINSTCERCPADESMEKYLSEIEMKLQLMSEDISASLEDLSSSSLLKVPRAIRETSRVRDDASSLRQTVAGILQRLEQAENSSAQSVATLAQIDTVKHHMEAARDTLQDAAGLAQLRASVEDVFASGDLARVADTLASMRKCLAVVGEVPEFADMKRQLASLEDRLEQMVLPRLSEALTQRRVDSTQSMRDILLAIGRYGALELQYIRVRSRPLKKLWDDFDSLAGGDTVRYGDWLPRYYDEVLLLVEQEVRWCSKAFDKEYSVIIPHFLSEAMAAVSSTFLSRIQATIQHTSDTQSQLSTLISLHQLTASFARNAQLLLEEAQVPSTEMTNVLLSIYEPYESYKGRYAELERAQLFAEIAALHLPGAAPRGLGAKGVQLSDTVRKMEGSVPAVILSLESAVERCISFTGGSEAEALLRTLDDVWLLYLSQLSDLLKSVRPLCGLTAGEKQTKGKGLDQAEEEGQQVKAAGEGVDEYGGDFLDSEPVAVANSGVEEEEEWALVQGVLQLLAVSESLGSRSSVFEASLKATISRLSSKLAIDPESGRIDAVGDGQAVDAAVLRLASAPEKAQRLARLIAESQDPRFHVLPHGAQRILSLQDSVADTVYEVLIGKVRRTLSSFAAMPIWSQQEEANLFDLPSFSAYPENYITVIGEYLLQLPQQLEPLALADSSTAAAGGDDMDLNDEQSFFATEWMYKVAEGATSLYLEQLRSIPSVSEKGARQLSADMEYLCNVLAALSMATPPSLATFQACLASPRENLAELIAAEAVPGGSLEASTAKLVAKMRKIDIN